MIAAAAMPSQANEPLPAGFQLDQYRIERQLSLGGFSIVYLAFDAHDTPVAIKEYLPNSLALRKATCTGCGETLRPAPLAPASPRRPAAHAATAAMP